MEAKHTPGRWELEYDEENGEFSLWMGTALENRGFYNAAHRITLYSDVYPQDEALYEEALANSVRIEAAINACEGIPTRALEHGVIAALITAAEDYLLGGKHDGECTNNPGGVTEGEACLEHLATSKERKAALRAALARARGESEAQG